MTSLMVALLLHFCRCSVCSDARWGCKWCLHDNLCRHSNADCGVVGPGGASAEEIQNRDLCPYIVHSSEILVPNNVSVPIRYDSC